MRSRGLRILFLVYVSVWFGAIVPGHTRGIVTMPGGGGDTAASVSSDSGCCATHVPSDENKPPAKPACAVCYFAAALMVAPPPTFDFAQLGLVGSLAPPVIDRLVFQPTHRPYHGRAPPAVA